MVNPRDIAGERKKKKKKKKIRLRPPHPSTYPPIPRHIYPPPPTHHTHPHLSTSTIHHTHPSTQLPTHPPHSCPQPTHPISCPPTHPLTQSATHPPRPHPPIHPFPHEWLCVGDNATVTVSILSGNTGSAFSASGTDLVLSSALDYETTQSYDLVLQATDGGSPPLTSQV